LPSANNSVLLTVPTRWAHILYRIKLLRSVSGYLINSAELYKVLLKKSIIFRSDREPAYM
jgi:hypothetical protein